MDVKRSRPHGREAHCRRRPTYRSGVRDGWEVPEKGSVQAVCIAGVVSLYSAMRAAAHGRLPERPMGADCKSVGLRLRRFESYTCHIAGNGPRTAETLPGGRCRREGRTLDRPDLVPDGPGVYSSGGPRVLDMPGGHAPLAQSVERFHGKEKVNGSIPLGGSEGSRVGPEDRHQGGVAQLVEQTTHNRCVAGSSPVTATHG